MSKSEVVRDWREARRGSARHAIVHSAWTLVHADGLAALSLRELARRAGITTPTVYAYFESKNAIYDALFAQAAQAFADSKAEPVDAADAHHTLVVDLERFVAFCTSDVARYQLLFQRPVPGFTPSSTAYAPAVRALEITRARL